MIVSLITLATTLCIIENVIFSFGNNLLPDRVSAFDIAATFDSHPIIRVNQFIKTIGWVVSAIHVKSIALRFLLKLHCSLRLWLELVVISFSVKCFNYLHLWW